MTMTGEDTRIQHCMRRLAGMEQERSSWEGHWREISDVMLPTKGRWPGDRENDGGKRNQKIMDSTAVRAVRILAAGMHGGLTSPSRPWFRLALADKEMEKHAEVTTWLQEMQECMHSVLANSNFYPTVHAHYAELSAFGTGAIIIEEDWRDVIRCRCLTAGEYYLDTDGHGRVDTLYRRFKMTPRQIVDRFPDTAPEQVRDMASRDGMQWLTVLHAIEPRATDSRDTARFDGQNKQFSSLYILIEGGKVVLEEDGYDEFPACCPRWDVAGSDVYGRGPGMDALPDVNMLQRMRADGLEALELEIKPPMNVSNQIKNSGGQFGLKPGFANFVDTTSSHPAITPTYQVRSNLQALDLYLRDIRQQIREHFYNDLFLLLTQTEKTMTATEVAERNAEKLIMLGPVLERLRCELFNPLINRVFNIMMRFGRVSPPPVIIQGQEWEIEIISVLALAQKSADINAMQQVTSYVAGLSQIAPGVLDKLDADEMVDRIARLLGVPAPVIRSAEIVEKIRGERQQAMQEQAELQQKMVMLKEGADIAQKFSAAGKAMEGVDLPMMGQMLG